MKWKRTLFTILISHIIIGLFFLQTISARPLGEDEKLIRVGTGAFTDGFYDIAEKQFSQFLKDYPDHIKFYEVCYLLGKTFYDRDKLKESKSLFLKILNENRQFEYMEYLLFWLADIELRSGNNEVARRYLTSLVNRYPKFENLDQSHYFLGLIEYGANRPSQAELHFKRVLALSKENELIQSSNFWLGILFFKQNRFEEAIGILHLVISDLKSNASLFRKYAFLWIGEAWLKLGKFGEAKRSYAAFIERFHGDPFVPDVYWKQGFCDYRMGQWKEAIEIFQSFKNQFKDSPLLFHTHYLLGEIFLLQGDHASSIKELNTLLTRSKENPFWGMVFLSLFWNQIQQNDFPGANKVFQRLQKLTRFDEEKAMLQWINAEIPFMEGKVSDALPYYFNILNTKYREKALWRIGKGYFFENKFREAMINFDILLLEFPNSQNTDETLFLKGECQAQSGNWTQALETYELIVRKDSRHHWRLYALTQMGNIYLSLKDLSLAERAFKKVIEDYPQHPLCFYAAFQLGKLYFRQNNILEAIHYYSMILKSGRPELLGGAYFSLGEIFHQQEKYDKAFKNFEMALQFLQETSPWFFLTHLEIGNLQRKNGQYEEAKKSYLTILSRTKDEDLKRAASEMLRLIEPE